MNELIKHIYDRIRILENIIADIEEKEYAGLKKDLKVELKKLKEDIDILMNEDPDT